MSKSTDHTTTDRLSNSAHDTVDQIAKNAARAEERIRHEAEDVSAHARDVGQKTKERTDDAMQSISAYVQDNPLISLGLAFAAGTLLSTFKRRS